MRTSQRPAGASIGRRGTDLGRPASTLTNRFNRDGGGANRFNSAAEQTITSVSNGSLLTRAARNDPAGPLAINVPAAPMLVMSSRRATWLGLNFLWPPTFAPLRKTICATGRHCTSPAVAFEGADHNPDNIGPPEAFCDQEVEP